MGILDESSNIINVHKPSRNEKDEMTKTRTLITAQAKGIQVVISKEPALYTAPMLKKH